jgi:hypothetical protein
MHSLEENIFIVILRHQLGVLFFLFIYYILYLLFILLNFYFYVLIKFISHHLLNVFVQLANESGFKKQKKKYVDNNACWNVYNLNHTMVEI